MWKDEYGPDKQRVVTSVCSFLLQEYQDNKGRVTNLLLWVYKYRSDLLELFSVNYHLDSSLTNIREKRECWPPASFS